MSPADVEIISRGKEEGEEEYLEQHLFADIIILPNVHELKMNRADQIRAFMFFVSDSAL